MKRIVFQLCIVFFGMAFMPSISLAFAGNLKDEIVVAQDGSGDYSTIQGAINSLFDSASLQRIIRIKKGIYTEKLFINKHMIKLEGEDVAHTIIRFPIARDIWRCENADDWGAAVVNLSGNDITLRNLTIINTYGFDDPADVQLSCLQPNGKYERKTVTKNSHQFALRSFESTRLQAVNCVFRSYAGDTVSPWNDSSGMYYFRDCVMEGGVDFYCPRGWAWAENVEFICKSTSAAIWHDGSGNKGSKSVIINSEFRGTDKFKLGRYHRDAQLYLINNRFSSDMADTPIYVAESSPGISWGHRIYYAGSKRDGGNFEWMKDNLSTAQGSPEIKDITLEWTFGGKWYPSEAGVVE